MCVCACICVCVAGTRDVLGDVLFVPFQEMCILIVPFHDVYNVHIKYVADVKFVAVYPDTKLRRVAEKYLQRFFCGRAWSVCYGFVCII